MRVHWCLLVRWCDT